MMAYKIQPVIACGGGGSRLWPVSTSETPKQFISLGKQGTLLETTVRRVSMVIDKCRDMNYETYEPLFIMHKSHSLPPELSRYESNIIYEDYANDTAVAITRAALTIKNKYPDENVIMLALPADHYIYNVDAFIHDITDGITHVTNDNIVLYGINPTSPETKYGYIIPGNPVTFKEKPTLDIALELLEQNALWNSGIFAANIDLIIDCIQKSPHNIMDWIKFPRNGKAPSFDIAVLQEYHNIYAYHCHGWRWSDIGTWDSFTDIPEIKHEMQESQGIIMAECSNINVLKRPKDSPGTMVLIGCENLFVVINGDNILIMSKKTNDPDEILATKDYNNILKELASNIK